MTRTNTSAWTRGGTAVEAGSASEAAQQAGLDWNVMLADMQAVRQVAERQSAAGGGRTSNRGSI